MDNIRSTGVTDENQANENQEELEEKRKQDAEKKDRATQCAQEIRESLVKWNCQFDVSVMLRQNGVFPNIQIVPKEEAKPEGIIEQ